MLQLTMRDFPAEIRTLWWIEQTELSGISFEPIDRPLGTIPNLDENGRVHVTVRFDPAMADEILWHEGAHVYLFHLGYPPCWFSPTPGPELFAPVDFVNEYLANKLEIDRRFPTQQERLAAVRQRLLLALERLPIRPMKAFPGVEKLAISAAMCAEIARQWTSTVALEVAEMFERTPPKVKAVYWTVSDALKRAPPIAFGSPRLTTEDVETIKELMSTSFRRVYEDKYSIRFTPYTQAASTTEI